ncbi:MAG TPA: hypothetical protein VIS48_07680 [Candidatus Kryptonia bacterium]
MNSSLNQIKFKCVFSDIDGVLTDSGKTYDLNGNVISKSFCDKDFTAINLFRKAGLRVIFVSADDRVNKALAESKKIEFLHSLHDSKLALISKFLMENSIARNEVIYVGDDLPDVECFEALPYSFCPSDAIGFIRERAFVVLERAGGKGCLMEIYELLDKGGIPE